MFDSLTTPQIIVLLSALGTGGILGFFQGVKFGFRASFPFVITWLEQNNFIKTSIKDGEQYIHQWNDEPK